MAAARGLPIPPADEVPPELEYRLSKKTSPDRPGEKSMNTLSIPIITRGHSSFSDLSPTFPHQESSLPSPSSYGPSTSPLFRTRAKTLASLTTSSKNNPTEMTPRELQLPTDPFVNGQPIEAYLYKDASECPICFLYYPPYLNTTRCCDQPICSECFVQIKRPDPHPPEHETPDPSAPPLSEAEKEAQAEGQLVSEVATCPYCKTPEFGITYVTPPFRRGLTYAAGSSTYQVMSAMSSQTSLSSSGMSPGPARRRGTSISANAPEVITTDKVRPDWANKLATARAHAARRSAAATALHTAAYLMNGQPDARNFGPFARRLRRPTLEGNDPVLSPHLSALAMLAERHAARQQELAGEEVRGSNPWLAPPRGSSTRRNRMDDLEDMMMMEAIRLSLASEEDRRKKEDKDAKKEAKKKEKEAKKAEKAGRKNSLFTLHSNTSNGENASSAMERQYSADSIGGSIGYADEPSAPAGKGKAADRPISPPTDGPSDQQQTGSRAILTQTMGASNGRTSQESLANSLPMLGSEPFKRSHLRQMSNVSSSASSFVDSGSTHGAFPGSNTPPGSSSLEPMFNFRSLAAMIGDEDKTGDSSHLEQLDNSSGPAYGRPGSFEEVDDKPGSIPISPVSPSSTSSVMPRDDNESFFSGQATKTSNGTANGNANGSAHKELKVPENGNANPIITPPGPITGSEA